MGLSQIAVFIYMCGFTIVRAGVDLFDHLSGVANFSCLGAVLDAGRLGVAHAGRGRRGGGASRQCGRASAARDC
jgi:hypothetical protein